MIRDATSKAFASARTGQAAAPALLAVALLALLAVAAGQEAGPGAMPAAPASSTDAAGAAGPAPAPAASAVAPAVAPDAPAAATPDALKPPAPDADKPRVRGHAHAHARTVQQGIDAGVARLTRALDLDADQQVKARFLLTDQYRQIRKLWTDNPQPDADRVGPTMAIMDHTREKLRAMLTDEQRKKYPGVTPRDLLGPAHSDVEHWLEVTRPKGGDAAAPAAGKPAP